MNNYQISDVFSLLSKLMDIHGENSFKSKSYSIAAFNIEKLPVQLSETPAEKIAALKGIGASTAQKITALLNSGNLVQLEDLLKITPPGVLEMLKIKGIGPKKIHTIWKEMEIETIGELLYACQENRLKLYKGFGEKTQQNVIDIIRFYLQNKSSHLYATVKTAAQELEIFLQKILPEKQVSITGKFKQQNPTLEALEFLVEAEMNEIIQAIQTLPEWSITEHTETEILVDTNMAVLIKIIRAEPGNFIADLVKTSSSQSFYDSLKPEIDEIDFKNCASEADFFERLSLPLIVAPIREKDTTTALARSGNLPVLIQPNDIRGIIHSHSNWSDGSNTIEEMAMAAKEKGLEYLVISDHSKSAFYAQGLFEEKIVEQHQYIDELNIQLAPFKIFKSIESDILYDGRLDYSEEVLKTFDLVIASVHSVLKMPIEKATERLLTAIQNPYTSILGHPTGRLLLSRKGYPLEFEKIIDACAAHHVVIEINANPHRLDLDWSLIEMALQKGVLLSINPDAHSINGINDIEYGVLAAQKGLLTKEKNLSSFNITQFETYLQNNRALKHI